MSTLEARRQAPPAAITPVAPPSPVHRAARRAREVWPGLLLTALIAVAAFALHGLPGVSTFSPLILAIVLGIAFHNVVGTPRRAKAGVTFGLRRILRLAIILLGFQLTVAQVVAVGGGGLLIIAATLGATMVFTHWLGGLLGVDWKLAQLIAAGTSICGASAVIATNTVTEAGDEDVAYAVACVTVFGSLAMVLYPALPGLLHLGPRAYGLWAGASIHEIAQVVAAAFQDGREAGEFATIAKLSRIMMLAPVVLALGFYVTRRGQAHAHRHARRGVPLPWFVFGFLGVVAVNSVIGIPALPKSWLVQLTTFLLTVALAAMGLETDIRKLRARGLKPLLLGAAAWAFIAGLSLALVELTGSL